jgi:hypothetical protein
MNDHSVFQSIVPQFTVRDVVRTAEYYRDVLGFKLSGYWKVPPVFAVVARDNVEIFFNLATSDTQPRTGRVSEGYDAYLKVKGLEGIAADLAARGADLLEGPAVREYGMLELVVRDCNGLVLAFGEVARRHAT